MRESVFVEREFIALIVFSFILPFCIYGYIMWKRAISRTTVLFLGLVFIVISMVNVFLLQRLAQLAQLSMSLVDDRLFASELSVAFYILPALFAGVGINMLSHVLIRHLTEAEREFDATHR
jgi:hypothetical protein